MSVYRLHIRPDGVSVAESFRFCLENKVLGVGWAIKDFLGKPHIEWLDYEKAGKTTYDGKISNVIYIKERIKKNDLIWTRNHDGKYYLAIVESDWKYLTTQQANDADVVNVVGITNIFEIPIDEVPGKIIACFRARRTVQAVDNKNMGLYSKILWNKKYKENSPFINEITPADKFDLFSLLDDKETEDVIFVYLQMIEHWVVIPGSRKTDTMGYEFYCINKDGKRALVQVKTGNDTFDPASLKSTLHDYTVYYFQSNGLYPPAPIPNVVYIDPLEIKSFIKNKKNILPTKIGNWFDFSEEYNQHC